MPLYDALSQGFRRGVSVWHRRAGKDKTLLNLLAKEAFKRVGAYYYFFPSYTQGRKIIWDGIDRDGFKFLNHIPVEVRLGTNATQMQIRLRNGSLIQILGSDNIDSIVGTNPVGCVFSEFSLQDPRGWDFVRPILRENGGWAFFNFTPRGKNHAWDLYRMAEDNPEWFCERLTIKDTGVLTEQDIEAERRAGMSDDLIEQEFFCSFEAAVPGAYFGQELRAARDQGRITAVPHVPGIPVKTWWDLGMDDSTTIWFSQDHGREVHFINYEEHSGEGLAFYAGLLREIAKERKFSYGDHWGPHDIEVRELGTGKSRREVAREMGLNFQACQRPGTKEDAIEAARKLLAYSWFDKDHCAKGIDALAAYRKDYDEKNQVYKLRPVHDWASHGADAFQTAALGHVFDNQLKRPVKAVGTAQRAQTAWKARI